MKLKFSVLLTFCCILSVLFGCEKTTQKEEFIDKSIAETSVKAEKVREVFQELRRIGSTTELKNDDTCKESGDILAYAETYKYHIYVCGDETNNQPKSMVINTVVGNSNKAIIDGNPSISWSKSYIFSQGEFSIRLGRPYTPTSYKLYKPSSPTFSVGVRFANESFINEKIRVYLFNEKIEPNYKKTMLLQDQTVVDRFSKYSSITKCNLPSGNSVDPQYVAAYEINQKEYLIELICFRPSYNINYQYILYSENSLTPKAKIIPFNTLNPSFIESGKIQKTELITISGVAQFFPEDNTLRVVHKGIGAGGCGSAEEYKLIEEKFELQEFRKYDCYSSGASQPSKSPEEFPKIYP
jgi:hypothetical protein